MNLEEKAIQYVMLDIELDYPKRESFKAGYKECISDIKDFVKANPKITADKITEYLNSL